jgi:hypothetical protein
MVRCGETNVTVEIAPVCNSLQILERTAVKLRGGIREATVTGKPDSPGSAKDTVKTIARGMPGDAGVTVVTCSCAFLLLRTRLRAHRAPGIPCAL